MDGSSWTVIVMPVMTLVALFTGIALAFIAAGGSGRSHPAGRLARAAALKRIGAARRKAWPPRSGADDAARVGYLYVPCARISYYGYPAQPRRWVQEVPIVRKTAKWIYYASDTWDRSEAVVSPGRISRQKFETDTRCHQNCLVNIAAGPVCAPHGRGHRHCAHVLAPCDHGYPAGVIQVPGDRSRPGPAGRLFFATRAGAERDLYRGDHKRAEQAARQAPPVKELRRAMADAHPDRGGTADQFIQARRRYQTALRPATVGGK